MRNIFPLRVGVPYKTQDGKRVEVVLYRDSGAWVECSDGLVRKTDTGVAEGAPESYNIVDLFIEPGLWRTRSGKTVEVLCTGLNKLYSVNAVYDPDYGAMPVTYMADGSYWGSGEASELDIMDYIGEIKREVPVSRITEGLWLRRDNRAVAVSYRYDDQRFGAGGKLYAPELDGAYSSEYATRFDLVRPITREEADTLKPYEVRDYIQQGFMLNYFTESRLHSIPEAWQAFTLEYYAVSGWGLTDKLRDYWENSPNFIPYEVDVKLMAAQLNVTAPRGYATLFYRDDEGKPHAKFIDKRLVHGGAYGANVEPKFHNTEGDLYNYNKPHATFNDTTNLYEYIERYVNDKVNSGEYIEVDEAFEIKYGTGAHISTQDPNMIAYYPTLRNIREHRAVKIKPGRYLRKYFPDMSDDEIRRMSAVISGGELKFYSNWQDMLAVYRRLDKDEIVSSCMSYDKWGVIHPLMVYDNSDVELAVLEMDGRPVARALYNKNTREYPMVYGQWEKMEQALTRAGFKHGSLDGARIRNLPRYINDSVTRDNINLDTLWEHSRRDEILMPYIDDHRELDRSSARSTNVDVFDDHCIIDRNGEYEANQHESVCLADARFECEHCGDRIHEEDTYYVEGNDIRICEDCYGSHTVEVFYRRNASTTYMRDYAESNFIYINGVDRWVTNNDVAQDLGYVYSEEVEEYIDIDEAVYIEEDGEWYPSDSSSVAYDEVEEEYVLAETLRERQAEREKEAEAEVEVEVDETEEDRAA